jgi:hypothetical protein
LTRGDAPEKRKADSDRLLIAAAGMLLESKLMIRAGKRRHRARLRAPDRTHLLNARWRMLRYRAARAARD